MQRMASSQQWAVCAAVALGWACGWVCFSAESAAAQDGSGAEAESVQTEESGSNGADDLEAQESELASLEKKLLKRIAAGLRRRSAEGPAQAEEAQSSSRVAALQSSSLQSSAAPGKQPAVKTVIPQKKQAQQSSKSRVPSQTLKAKERPVVEAQSDTAELAAERPVAEFASAQSAQVGTPELERREAVPVVAVKAYQPSKVDDLELAVKRLRDENTAMRQSLHTLETRFKAISESSEQERAQLAPAAFRASVEQAGCIADECEEPAGDREASVVASRAVLRAGPTRESIRLMTLGPGTRVSVELTRGEWTRVVTRGGVRAWVPAETLSAR
jgi:uncharacterized protein YgiM (DUF1202 family)